ncbi:MAG: hypothetical protein WCY05_05095 [Candidatus Omnitrophota bacterium]
MASELKFKLALNREQVIFKKEKIDFTVGVEKSSLKLFSLFGKWKHDKNTLEFIAKFGQKKINWIFRVKKIFSAGKELNFELINTKGKPIGVELTLSKKVFQDANIFIKAKRGEDSRIEAGFYTRF